MEAAVEEGERERREQMREKGKVVGEMAPETQAAAVSARRRKRAVEGEEVGKW